MLHVFSSRTYLKALKKLLLLIVVSSSSFSYANVALAPSDQNVSARVKSFLEWKNSKVSEAENKVKLIKEKLNHSPKRQLSNSNAVAAKNNSPEKQNIDPNLKHELNNLESGLSADLQNQLDEELLNLSNTQDLTISDYFVGYVTKQANLDSTIEEVSARLSPEEVAQLMKAYVEQINQKPTNVVKTPLRADLVSNLSSFHSMRSAQKDYSKI